MRAASKQGTAVLPQQRIAAPHDELTPSSAELPLVSVDPLAEATYVCVSKRSASRAVPVHPQVTLHLDSDDHVVAVEILD